ncbi:hypothetical protein VTO73DRAFT_13049 [Trametes versicolor]
MERWLGLVFLHDHEVAHRDCAFKNIMMDASALFPCGFHPISKTRLPDVSGSAPTLSLSKAPVKNYFIDFGISTRFAPQSSRLVVGTPGPDQEPPELSDNVPYDPFKLDVFLIGNLIRRGLPALYSNLTMLEPIMNQMVHRDPARRPTAADAHQQFKAIRRSVPTLSQYWLLQPRNSFIVVKAARGVYSLVYAILRLAVMSSAGIEFTSIERLRDVEIYWAEKSPLFEAHGYKLRPRFQPGWTPSWRGKPLIALLRAEDALSLHARVNVIDARCTSDGKLVYLKKIRPDSQELEILRYISSPDMVQHPQNHCVPLLDVIYDPSDPETCFIVMPYLRYIDHPPFELVEDMMEFGEVILEGLVFLHDHGVAHRDCAYKNIMMDASAMFPQGFHPMRELALPDVSGLAPILHRVDVPVRYYYIDFGISTRFSPDQGPTLVLGTQGLDDEVPELSDTIPYDPFKTDIFIVGNLFRQQFLQAYSNADMLTPLVRRMISKDPNLRPGASDALREWKAIRRRVSSIQRYWRLRPVKESWLATLYFEFKASVVGILTKPAP